MGAVITPAVAVNERRWVILTTVRVYASMAFKKSRRHPHTLASDWESKLTTCIGCARCVYRSGIAAHGARFDLTIDAPRGRMLCEVRT